MKRKKGDPGTEEGKKPKKQKASKAEATNTANSSNVSLNDLDFSSNAESPLGKLWNLKISSWNVNGLRACIVKNGLGYIEKENPDIICFQETKCSESNIPDEIKNLKGYHSYWVEAKQAGYSGVGMLSKIKPLDVTYGIGNTEHDNEGRVITAHYEGFYLVTTYVPNAGRGLVRLSYRLKWDDDFKAYLSSLKEKKPVIVTGDMNVAHEEIDIANPKSNKKTAGFTIEERTNFTQLLAEGFADTFRSLYPEETQAYTFWSYMANARAKNIGWRLDYFLVSENFKNNVCDSVIRKNVYGSDHCPISLLINI